MTNPAIGAAIEGLKGSALFAMSLGSKELFHSNFLQWIFSVNPNMFIAILRQLGVEISLTDTTRVLREYKNYDLCVIREKDTIDLVIENKVKSIPNKGQLNDYLSETPHSRHLLLTLISKFEGEEEIRRDNNWKIATYSDLTDAIHIAAKSAQLSPYHSAIINDYISFIRNLDILVNECGTTRTPAFFNPYLQQLKEIRIDDLIEKLRACEMALELSRLIGETKSLNRIAMFEQCAPGDVIINYGLTHGVGLFELKVMINPRTALLIQIQGNHYCHAIELYKTGLNDKDNWNAVYSDPDYHWFLFPEISPSRKSLEYNKFGNEFLYRYRKITPDATAANLIAAVHSDYLSILHHLFSK